MHIVYLFLGSCEKQMRCRMMMLWGKLLFSIVGRPRYILFVQYYFYDACALLHRRGRHDIQGLPHYSEDREEHNQQN